MGTTVMIILPFHSFPGESFSACCFQPNSVIWISAVAPIMGLEFGIIAQFEPIFSLDTLGDSPLSTLHQDACNILNLTPGLHISIRVLDSDQYVRWRTRAFRWEMACPRSEQAPKSNVVGISICYRQSELYQSRKYGYKFEAFPQDLKRSNFRLRYTFQFWHGSGVRIFLSSSLRVCTGSFHLWGDSFSENSSLWYTFTLIFCHHIWLVGIPLEFDKCTIRHIFNEIMIGLCRIYIQEMRFHCKYGYIYDFLSFFHESFISDSFLGYELKAGGHCDFCDFRLWVRIFSDSIGRNFSFTSHHLRHKFSNLCRGWHFKTNSGLVIFLNSLPKLSHFIFISLYVFPVCIIFPSYSLALYIHFFRLLCFSTHRVPCAL